MNQLKLVCLAASLFAAVDSRAVLSADPQEKPFLYVAGSGGGGGVLSAASPEKDVSYQLIALDAAPQKMKAYLGVRVGPVDPVLRNHLKLGEGAGIVVQEVIKGSPAETAGLQVHDILQKLDDQLLVNSEQLATLISRHKKGDTLSLAIIHEGSPKTIQVALAEKAADEWRVESIDPFDPLAKTLRVFRFEDQVKSGSARNPVKRTYLGVGVEELPPGLGAQLSLEKGVLVTLVEPGSPADQAGVKKFDIVIRINERSIGQCGELVSAIHELKKGDTVTLHVLRGGKPVELKAVLAEKDAAAGLDPFQSSVVVGKDMVVKGLPPGSMDRVIINRLDAKSYLKDILKDLQPDDQKNTKSTQIKTVTITGPQSSGTHLRLQSNDGEIIIQGQGNGQRLMALDAAGKILYDGPINSPEEKSKLPEAVRHQLQHLGDLPNAPAPEKVEKSIRLLAPKASDPVIY
jgi:S1-C subfamily serine protease